MLKTENSIWRSMVSSMQEDIYAFNTLQEVIDFFEVEGIPPDRVGIGGSFGGMAPTEDDDPVFIWSIQ